ncbi:MAG: histidine kinase dimerization/phosphoacceptor domain -containing protein [Humidesulfovibrio sp.]|nr:histidine kinase dimerization/phosphoacceptor domain -containing protein [Humidesulfovibrio sp.]
MRPVPSIRLKLLFLVVLASLPALGLVLYSGLSAERQALRRAEANAGLISRNLALRQQQLTASTRQFLATLAQLPSVRNLDGKACAPLFRELLTANPVYSDIVLSNTDGQVLASAKTNASNLSLRDAPYFAEVLRTRDFAISGYRKSRTTWLDVIVCALPVLGPRREVLGVVSTGLRLDIFDEIVRDIELPSGSTVFLADSQGLRLFNRYYPTSRPDLYPIGGPVTLSQRKRLKDAASESPFYALDLRNQRRLYVVQESRLRPDAPPYLYVGVSLPVRTLIAEARKGLLSSLFVLATAALLTGLAAWLAGRKIFVERIERLASVAGRFAAGDLSARTGLSAKRAGRDELGQLAQAVDGIGEELSAREAERETTLSRLARTQFAVDNAGNEIYWTDEQGRYLYVNRHAAESLGYTPEELQGRSMFEVDQDFTPERWREFVELLAALGPQTVETRHRTRSGAIVPKEINASLVADGESRLVFGSGHDISERKRQEAVLHSLLDETVAVTGQDFFNAFTSQLLSILGVHAAFIGEYLDSPPTRMRTLSISSIDNRLTPIDFPLAETPGRDIPDNGFLVVAQNVRQRYPEAVFVNEEGIESYLGVPILNPKGLKIGHLSIMSKRPMPDDPMLISTLRLFAQRASAEIMRLRAERDTLASLREKEVLLKEIHHRVKNNMQIVSSLLSLQARDVQDEAVLDLLAESRARILSMALVHEDLYQTGNLAQVDFRHYLGRLVERVRTAVATASGVTIKLDLAELSLAIDQAIPLGLLCNELLTNALKHAFKDRKPGTVRLLLRREEGHASITVRDNGRGLPEGFVPGEGSTLGLQLVWSLAGQLAGEATAHTDGGAVFSVRFPLP